MRQHPDRVLFEAMDPPAFPDDDVAFVKQALENLSHSSGATPSRTTVTMTTSRSFTLLCTVGVFCFISYNMVRMPVLALFAESLGASPERIGLIVSVSTLTGVFLKLPSGALSDIYGRRLLLQIGVVAFGLPPFLYPWVTDLDVLTALRFFHGLATAIFAPSALATVADLYRERRGAALGTYTASTQSGALLGPFIGGYLIYASGFSAAFVTAGIFGCIAIAIFYSLHLTSPPPRVQEKGMAPLLAEMWKGFRVVAKNRKVLDHQLDRRSQDDCERSPHGLSPALWRLGGIESGRSRAVVYGSGPHVACFQTDYGPRVRQHRASAAHRHRSRDLRSNLCLYPTGVDVLAALVALGRLWFRRSRGLLLLFRAGCG